LEYAALIVFTASPATDGTPWQEYKRPDAGRAQIYYADDFQGISEWMVCKAKPPVAAATADRLTGTAPLTVAFDASSSYDPAGPDVGHLEAYEWDFGDGVHTTRTDALTEHEFTTEGDYEVTLVVTDDDGLTSDPFTISINVESGPIVDPELTCQVTPLTSTG